MGVPSRRSRSTSKLRSEADGDAVDHLPGGPGRQEARPRRQGRPAADLVDSFGCSTPRQALLLRKVVDGFAATGQPVGSKALAADPDVACGPSTIRNELAVLEEHGLLAHPHTSAGRVADRRRLPLLRRPPAARARPARPDLRLSLVRREVDEAMRVTTETLSQVTNLLAIVSAPPIETTTIRHIEVLLLQPQVLMVVIITSTGGVSKRVFTFDRPVDPGLDAGPETRGLTEGVRNQRELRTPPFVVALAVVRPHDDTVPGREDRPPVPDVALDRLGGEQRPPVPTAGGSVAVVHADEVDGVGRGEQVGPVARYAPSRAVLGQPAAGERQRQDHRVHRRPLASRRRHPSTAARHVAAQRANE